MRAVGERGFSLVEMLVVLSIFSMLVALVGPTALDQLKASRVKAAEVQIAQLRASLDIYLIDVGRYPTAEQGLSALAERGGSGSRWRGPYIRGGEVPKDPWGHSFLYEFSEDGVRVMSYGADGVRGGEGANADLEG